MFLLFLATGFVSCSDFLEVQLDDEILTSEAIVNKETAEAAVIGLYNNMQSATLYGGDQVLVADLLSGNGVATGFQPFYEEIANARVSAGNAYVENVWIELYNVINAANNILANIDEIAGIDEENRNRIRGSAQYFRAMALFDLLRQFGEFFEEGSSFGIPVFTEVLDRSSALTVARASVADTYSQIIADLNQAEALLPENTPSIFISKAAAQAMLARVLLYKKDYEQAEEQATKVIDNDRFELNPAYAQNFEEEGSDEIVFELEFNQQDGQDLSNLLVLSTANEVSATEALYESFGEEDPRRAFFTRQFGIYRCTKYGELATDIDRNVPLIRLAEIYLIRSEARAFQGNFAGAVSDLNQVRTRSLPDAAYSDEQLTGLEAFSDALLLERKLELAFEGQYWFDLVRYGRATELRGVESYRRILPIPLREVQVSNGLIVQNDGY
jgi:tetratricopeptide (TPR) repeat protein